MRFRFRRRSGGRIIFLERGHSGRPTRTGTAYGSAVAFEAAGVIGKIAAHFSGMFRTTKRVGLVEGIVEIRVYLLKVENTLEDWPVVMMGQTQRSCHRGPFAAPSDAAAWRGNGRPASGRAAGPFLRLRVLDRRRAR